MRRLLERSVMYRTCQLSIPGEITLHSCTLRDFTVRGAGTRLRDVKLLPLEFSLSFDGFGGFIAAWSGGKTISQGLDSDQQMTRGDAQQRPRSRSYSCARNYGFISTSQVSQKNIGPCLVSMLRNPSEISSTIIVSPVLSSDISATPILPQTGHRNCSFQRSCIGGQRRMTHSRPRF